MDVKFEYTCLAVPLVLERTSAPYDTRSGRPAVNHGVEAHPPKNINEQLNKLAAQGWELVTVASAAPQTAPTDEGGSVVGVPLMFHYFKRKLN